MSTSPDDRESERISGLYETLRLKLLDLSKRNRMLNYPLGPRAKRHVQIVSTTLDWGYSELLAEGATLKVEPLREPDGTPRDEKLQEFVDAFEHAKVTDVEYLAALEGLINTGRDDENAIERLERELRDRVRSTLGWSQRPKRTEVNRAEHAKSLGINPNLELKPDVVGRVDKGGVLQTLKYPDELASLMEKLKDEARLAEQEAGLSTLFLAFGFLEWYESDASDKPLFAPLLLLPVKIDRQTIKGKEVNLVVAREGAAETNVSLRKLLEKEFDCVLPDYDIEELDEVGSVEGYLAKVRESIEGLKRWSIRRWLVLGHFAFSRIVMYEDTKPEKWDTHPINTNLVGALLKGYEQVDEASDLPSIASEDYPIDNIEIERLAPFLVQDADASQHSALVDVMKSRNLVLHGPPGTGKSQTITNVIANALGFGRTVLFLSEKQAALNVVKRGLDRAGLGDFCLEVHSDKSSAKTVIANLARRYQLASEGNAAGSEVQTNTAWQSSRKQIAEYVEALHAEDEQGATPFKLMWKSIRHRTTYARLLDVLKSISLPADLVANGTQTSLLRDRLDIYAMSAHTFSDSYGSLESFAWYSTPPQNVMIHSLDEMINAIEALQTATADLVDIFDVHRELGIITAADFSHVAVADAALSDPPDMGPVAAVSSMNIDALAQCLAQQAAYLDAKERLGAMPAHDFPDVALLSRASQIRSALSHSELSELSAPVLYRSLENSIKRGQDLLDSVDALRPAMLIFGASGPDPMSLVDAIASSIGLVSEIEESSREWISASDIDEQAFSGLYRRWKSLEQEEQALRELIPDAGDEPWPAAVDCTATAETLRMSGLSKFFNARSDRARVANKISERFPLNAPRKDAARSWERIGVHVEAIDAFNQDPEAGRALGRFWLGVESPFEELDAGVRWRQHVRSRLIPLPHGEKCALHIMGLPSAQLSALAQNEAAAASYRASRDSPSPNSGDISVDDTLARHRTELSSFKDILEMDVNRQLTRSNLSIGDLAAIYTAQTKLAGTKAAVDNSVLAAIVKSLAPGKVEVAAAMKALAGC
jgi:hypothetical protein